MPIAGQKTVPAGNGPAGRRWLLLPILLLSLSPLSGPLEAQAGSDPPGNITAGLSLGSLPVRLEGYDRDRLITISAQIVLPASATGSIAVIADYCTWTPPETGGQQGGIGPYPELKVNALILSVGGFAQVMKTAATSIEAGIFLGISRQREWLDYDLFTGVTTTSSPLDLYDHTSWLVTADVGGRLRSTPVTGPAIAFEVTRLEILTRWDPDEGTRYLSFQPGFRFRLTLLYPIPSKR